jgi:predicted metal-dependent hydrolase
MPEILEYALAGTAVPMKLGRSSSRSTRLRIVQGFVEVQTPSGKLGSTDKEFLERKARWILKHLKQSGLSVHQKKAYLANIAHQAIVYGEPVEVKFIGGAHFRYRLLPGVLELTVPPRAANVPPAKIIREALKQLAANYLQRELALWAEVSGLKVNRVSVKDHRSKWGSCSSMLNINLNWHLVLLPKSTAEYVIIHELMHLREMNHGPKFWAWVEKYYPRYQDAIQDLKRRQWMIGLYDGNE